MSNPPEPLRGPNGFIPQPLLAGRFSVGPLLLGFPFQSIQAAIDAATAAGFNSFNNPAVIDVFTGTYVEDVVMARGIIVRGNLLTRIQGSVTFDLGPGAPIDQNIAALDRINVLPTSGPAIVVTGTDPQTVALLDVSAESVDAEALRVDNTGGSFTFTDEGGFLNLAGNASPTVRVDAGLLVSDRLSIEHEDVGGTALAVTNPAVTAVALFRGDTTGVLDVDESLVIARYMHMESDTATAINLAAPATFIAEHCIVDSSNATVVAGTGTYASGGTIYATNDVIAGTISQNSFAFDGAENLTYQAASAANWAGSPPTRDNAALDRIAAAVGPIP